MDDYTTLTLKGNHYAMGWQHGHQVGALRPWISQVIEARFRQIERDGADERFERLVRETREVLQEFSAPLLDMIRGQADALQFEYETLLRYDLVTYLHTELVSREKPDVEGCTTWAATGSATADGQPILAKNRDYSVDYLRLQVVIDATPKSGYRYVCSGSAGCPGIFCAGINEMGLAVADTHVCSPDLGPGLPDYALMMHILEEHDSVSAALDYLRSVPRMGRNNLILADSQGHLAVFEIGHRRYGLFESDDGTLVNTNHFVSPELRDCCKDIGRTHERFEKATNELEGAFGQVDVPFAKRLMATHAGPASICNHPGTISASIFLPSKQTMLFCHGLPCQGHYDEFVLD